MIRCEPSLNVSAPCQTCGTRIGRPHVCWDLALLKPTDGDAFIGFFCERHCPKCKTVAVFTESELASPVVTTKGEQISLFDLPKGGGAARP